MQADPRIDTPPVAWKLSAMTPRSVAAAAVAGALAATILAAPAGAAARQPIQVGSLTLAPCDTSTLAWCATTAVPFDHDDPSAGTTAIYFEWFPATDGAAEGTVMAVQGGPGYSSTDYRDDYLAMLGPLTRTRNVLIADLRGTGRSDPVNCPAVQRWTVADGNQAYIDAVGACGDRLNRMRQRPDGSYVRGADLYTTATAARDVAVLLNRLNPGKIDLYGDSYGTYFGQVFASRYPGRLRSLTLDSAYPVLGADPFYPDAITTARAAFDKVCARAPACAAAAPGSSWARISAFVSRLRTHPVDGVDVDTLIQLVLAAGADSGVYRELDPAIRAYEDRGDLVPLTRLVDQTIDPSEDGGAVAEFSSGLYVANFCNDYPQPFSYAASNAQRRNQYQAAVAALPANMFAPFTVQEWVSSGSEEFDTCLKWPAPVTDDPPVVKTPPLTPNLPVLVLSGELDSLTTPAEGRRVAEQMGPSARWVRVDNMYHVTAMLDFVDCAEGIVRRFIRTPAQLSTMDVSCASDMPEVHVVGAFPLTLAQTTPAAPAPGNQAGADGRRLAAIGASVVGDTVWHWWYIPGDRGDGLRGGRFRFEGDGPAYTATLTNVRWTDDTRVNGTLAWHQETGRITASLTVTGPGTLSATVDVAYDDYQPGGRATLTGTTGGKALAATVPIP